MRSIYYVYLSHEHQPHLAHAELHPHHGGDAAEEVLQAGVAQRPVRDRLPAQRAVLGLEPAYRHPLLGGQQHRPQYFFD